MNLLKANFWDFVKDQQGTEDTPQGLEVFILIYCPHNLRGLFHKTL